MIVGRVQYVAALTKTTRLAIDHISTVELFARDLEHELCYGCVVNILLTCKTIVQKIISYV